MAFDTFERRCKDAGMHPNDVRNAVSAVVEFLRVHKLEVWRKLEGDPNSGFLEFEFDNVCALYGDLAFYLDHHVKERQGVLLTPISQ